MNIIFELHYVCIYIYRYTYIILYNIYIMHIYIYIYIIYIYILYHILCPRRRGRRPQRGRAVADLICTHYYYYYYYYYYPILSVLGSRSLRPISVRVRNTYCYHYYYCYYCYYHFYYYCHLCSCYHCCLLHKAIVAIVAILTICVAADLRCGQSPYVVGILQVNQFILSS